MRKKKTSIELLRFVFCIMILIYHGCVTFYTGEKRFLFCRQGEIGVEFFFILSGLLMARHVEKQENNYDKFSGNWKLGEETFSYVLKKYGAIFPIHCICFIILFMENLWVNGTAILEAMKTFIYALPELFLIQMGGINIIQVNGNDWYCSALLLGTLILYPILKRFPNLFEYVIAPLLVFFIFGLLYNETQSMAPSKDWMGFAFKGILRGIADMSLGVITYTFSEKLSKLNLKKAGIWMLNTLEILCYFSVFIFASSTEPKYWCFILVFVIAIGLMISYSHYSVLKRISDNKIIQYLGKLSLVIFLCQRIILTLVQNFWKNGGYIEKQLIYIIGTFVLSIVLQLFLDYGLKPMMQCVKKALIV